MWDSVTKVVCGCSSCHSSSTVKWCKRCPRLFVWGCRWSRLAERETISCWAFNIKNVIQLPATSKHSSHSEPRSFFFPINRSWRTNYFFLSMFETGVDCYSRWTDNGEVFNAWFRCRKCSVVMLSLSFRPLTGPLGGSGLGHMWSAGRNLKRLAFFKISIKYI